MDTRRQTEPLVDDRSVALEALFDATHDRVLLTPSSKLNSE